MATMLGELLGKLEKASRPDRQGEATCKRSPVPVVQRQGRRASEVYVSIFPNSKEGHITRRRGRPARRQRHDGGLRPRRRHFVALNGGPQFTFTPAVLFVINCETQAEIDRYWDKLSEGGRQIRGWLQDKYGLSWRSSSVLSSPWATRTRRAPTAPCRRCSR
jgi:predicted 3-demethylubiquinone-9 3-methyltransferase (glyoxalase superfamily)